VDILDDLGVSKLSAKEHTKRIFHWTSVAYCRHT